MNALDVELDARETPFLGALLFDELEPLVIDMARIEIDGREARATPELVVAGEPGLAEDRVHGSASPAAIWGERLSHQRLRAVHAAGASELRRLLRGLTDGGSSGGHGASWWWCSSAVGSAGAEPSCEGAWQAAGSPWRRA